MKRIMSCITALIAVSAFLAPISTAQNTTASDVKVTYGKGRVLWERVSIGDKPYSDFTTPENAKLLDISGSKAGELKGKVKALNAAGDCKITKGQSKHGDDIVTLENGLVKVVVILSLGGRIIEISNKATGANIFLDNYQNAAKPDPDDKNVDIGGWYENLIRGDRNSKKAQHTVEVVKKGADEVVIRTSAKVELKSWTTAPVTVERTIGIRKASAHVSLNIKFTNHSGKEETEMKFCPQVRHALGADGARDEFWLSSLGYVTYVPPHGGDLYVTVRCEEKIDTWQGIVDRTDREGVVVLPGGEISNKMDIYGFPDGKRYTYENYSTRREHVLEGDTLEMRHDYAPVLNFDAITYANPQLAVELVPEKRHFAPGERVRAIAGAAMISGGKGSKVTLQPRIEHEGKVLAELKVVRVDAPFLVADPKETKLSIPANIPAGRHDLVVDVLSGGTVAGTFRYKVFVAEPAGAFLAMLDPNDDGFGKGFSVSGTLKKAQVSVARSKGGKSRGSYKLDGAELPWTTEITPVGSSFKVEHSVDFSAFPKDALLQSFGMCFPFRLGTDISRPEQGAHRLRQQYQKMLWVTVGSKNRDEQWLVDQGRGSGEQEYQKPIPSWALSDSADRYPVWRFGGTLQIASTAAWIWKSAGYDVAPTPTVQEEKSAGWLDVWSRLTKQGVLVYMPGMDMAPPKELIVDGEMGRVIIYFFPPHMPAMSLKKAGSVGKSRAELWGLGADNKVSFTFFLHFHGTDLAGHLPSANNVASKIRALVKEMKYRTSE